MTKLRQSNDPYCVMLHALRHFYEPVELSKSPLICSSLVIQKQRIKPHLTPPEALQRVLEELLLLAEQGFPRRRRVLSPRFLKNQPIAKVAETLNYAERTIQLYQKAGVKRMVEWFRIKENHIGIPDI